MKTIKLNFTGFWPNFDKEHNLFCNILREKYEVEITDNPDFLIASPLGAPMEYLKYDCVRILFTGEPLVPDFNIFDYAIGFDYLSFPDSVTTNRYYRYPLCLYDDVEQLKKASKGLTYEEAKETLAAKKYFCNFIYGHQSAKGEREAIFSAIQKYKRVESAGSFLNNMPDGISIPYSEKMDFLKLCKFTIACESISYPGFVTEKLVNPLYSNSVPIYYGNPLVEKEFNPQAMINLHDYSSLEEGVERVIEVDRDDDLYIRMLMEPKMVSDDYLDNIYSGLREFLLSIFAQDPEAAFRRMRFYFQKQHEEYLKEYRRFRTSLEYRIFKKAHPQK